MGFESAQRELHAFDCTLQSGVGIKHHAKTHSREVACIQRGGLAANHNVDDLRGGEALGDFLNFLGRLGCFDKQHIGPSFLVSMGSVYRSFKAFHRSCIRASNDEEVIVASGIHRGLDFAYHLSATDHALIVEVTAFLGADLIFELNGIGPSSF